MLSFMKLLPILLSVLGRNKPQIEGPIKGVIDLIGGLSKDELEESIEAVDVKVAQEKLTTLGYDPGPIDGFAGRRTQAAISEFQKDNNLTVDGLLGQKTWDSLKRG